MVPCVLAAGKAVVNDVVVDEAGRMLLIETNQDEKLPSPDIIRLVNPNRLVIDIPDSVLKSRPKFINVNKNDIRQVRIFPLSLSGKDVVRIIMETTDSKVIDKIKLASEKGSTIIQVEEIPTNTQNNTVTSNDTLQITKIDYRDGQLIVGGMGKVRLNEPFILKEPMRLVYDIPNAQVANKQLLSPILVGDDLVKLVRIGQFDEKTVRLVIETDSPNKLYPVYASDLHTVFITSNLTFNPKNLPTNVNLGRLNDIHIAEVKGLGTVVRLNTSTLPVQRIKRLYSPDKVVIDLINIKEPDKDITSKLPKTAELAGVTVAPLMAGNNNSRVILDLNNPNVQVKSSLSADGSQLEVVLQKVSEYQIAPHTGRGLSVVIDAGHGGYDPGCMADGYSEKDITLDVSKQIKQILQKAGVKVYMSRESDKTLSLKERTTFTNSVKPDVFVSVHVNASISSSPEGISTHYYTPQSLAFAKTVQSSMINKISAVDRGISKNMFYVVHHTDVPAVLVEIGFLTNPGERVKLLTTDRKNKTAQAISEGILKFLKK